MNFDRLILMCDGNIVYQGVAREVADYFNMKKARENSVRKNFNPCDFFMAALSVNYPKTKEDLDKIVYYLDKYDAE